MQNPFVKWSLIAAIFTILLKLTTYLINPELVDGGLVGFVTFAVLIFCLFKIASEERALRGGFITFGEAFKPLFIGCAIYFGFTLLFDYVFKSFIAPELIEIQMEKAVQLIESMMDMMGQEVTDEQYAEIEEGANLSLWSYIQGYAIQQLCGGSILSAIMSAMMKKDNPNQDLL